MKSIDKVLFDESDGLNGRFRDEDYTVLPEEKDVINQYIDKVLLEAYQNGFVSIEDFLKVIKMIEIFEGTMNSDVLDMVYAIYWKFDELHKKEHL